MSFTYLLLLLYNLLFIISQSNFQIFATNMCCHLQHRTYEFKGITVIPMLILHRQRETSLFICIFNEVDFSLNDSLIFA